MTTTTPRLDVLLDRHQIAARVAQLGDELNRRLAGQDDVLLVALLRGAVFFFVDLLRAMGSPDWPFELVRASSYADHGEGDESARHSSGSVTLEEAALAACRDRHVVLIDDIIDTGLTLSTLTAKMRERGARGVTTIALLDKASRRTVNFNADIVGFEIPDHFVVGYGLDCAGKHRSLPDICVLSDDTPTA